MFAPITNLLKNLFILVVTHLSALVAGFLLGIVGYAGLCGYFEEKSAEEAETSESPSPTEL